MSDNSVSLTVDVGVMECEVPGAVNMPKLQIPTQPIITDIHKLMIS